MLDVAPVKRNTAFVAVPRVGVSSQASAGWLLWEAWIWVIGHELSRCAVVDESLVKEPLDGPTLGSDIAQRVPRRDQIWMVFVELVLEPPERSSSLQRLRQLSTGNSVADAIGKVSHVLKPHRRRQRVDEDQIELLDLDGVLPINARIAGPEDDLTRSRVDQPSVLKVSLIGESRCDLINIDSEKIEHPLRVRPEHTSLEKRSTAATPHAAE